MFDTDGDDFPFAKMLRLRPASATRSGRMGYPTAGGQRALRWIRGSLLGCRTFEYQALVPRERHGFPTNRAGAAVLCSHPNSEVCGCSTAAIPRPACSSHAERPAKRSPPAVSE